MGATARRLPAITVLLALLCPGAPAANDGVEDENVVRELLALPAPLRDYRRETAEWLRRLPPGQGLGTDGTPEDEAPLDLLTAYWERAGWRSGEGQGPEPSPRVRERLLSAGLAEPDCLYHLIRYLPDRHDVHTVLRAAFGPPEGLLEASAYWREAVGDWLVKRCRRHLPLLARLAAGARDSGRYVSGDEWMDALAAESPPLAIPVLTRLATTGGPQTKALALALLCRIATGLGAGAAPLRALLADLVEDPAQPGAARGTAMAELMRADFPGRREWFLSLFARPGLFAGCDGPADYVAEDPGRWVAPVAGLLTSEDPEARHTAVWSLICAKTPDAFAALLPLLRDRAWPPGVDRTDLIEGLGQVDVPGSLEVLLEIARNEDAPGRERSAAAVAYAHRRGPGALPLLRDALARETAGPEGAQIDPDAIIGEIALCDELTDAERVEAVLAYLRTAPRDLGSAPPEASRPYIVGENPLILLGFLLRDPAMATDGLARLLVEARTRIAPAEPEVAHRLDAFLAWWPVPLALGHTLAQLARGDLDATALAALIGNRTFFGRDRRAELSEIAAGGGLPAGIAAALLDEPGTVAQLLAGEDRIAAAGLLAASRLTRGALDPAEVGKLLESADPLLVATAEAWLSADDHRASREVLWAAHPGEARIYGAGVYWWAAAAEHVFIPWEEELRREVLTEPGPQETHALLMRGGWGARLRVIVRVRESGATLFTEDDPEPGERPADRHERDLSEAELAALLDLLSAQGSDDLPPVDNGGHDAATFEYLMLRREGGRRLTMYDVGDGDEGLDFRHRRILRTFLALVPE